MPILGICVGLQVLLEYSEENDTHCLSIISGRVRQFPKDLTDATGRRLKIPHMGWNSVDFTRRSSGICRYPRPQRILLRSRLLPAPLRRTPGCRALPNTGSASLRRWPGKTWSPSSFTRKKAARQDSNCCATSADGRGAGDGGTRLQANERERCSTTERAIVAEERSDEESGALPKEEPRFFAPLVAQRQNGRILVFGSRVSRF